MLAHDRSVSFTRDARSLSLDELLGEARDSYAAELHIPLTVDQPPVLFDRAADGEWTPLGARGAQIGLSMSAQMYRRIGHPQDDYGNVFPVARALDDLRGWCYGVHLRPRTGPWEDHTRDIGAGAHLYERVNQYRPLCARLAFYTVAWKVPLARLALLEILTRDRAEELLLTALRHAWDQRREYTFADGGGAQEVIADQRRERRAERAEVAAARARAEASRADGVVCRDCGGPFDPASEAPCPSAATEAFAGVIDVPVLCRPSVSA